MPVDFSRAATSAGGRSALTPIRPKSLPESVAEQLRGAILAGQLKPGERLIEQKLAAGFGIGQPTLREALKELEFQGFLRKVPTRGTYVTDLSPDDMKNRFEVRMSLELLAVEKATLHHPPQAIDELRAHIEAMRAAAEDVDLAAFHRSDLLFHHAVWALANNEHLVAALDRVTSALFAFVLLRRGDVREGYLASVAKHAHIVDAIATGDPNHACTVFREEMSAYWRKYHGLTS